MSSFLDTGVAATAAQNVLAFIIGKRRVRLGQGVTPDLLPVGTVELDASLEELHTVEIENTQHPVERGADVTDHVRIRPLRVRVTGIVTNTPIEFLASLTNSSSRAEEADEALELIMRNQQLITVVTSLRQYENMILKRKEVPRSAQLGNVVRVTMELEEIIIVDSETVAAPTPVAPTAAAVSDLGKSAPPPNASAATSAASQQRSSVLVGIGSFFGG